MMFMISTSDRMPDVAVHGPGLPPLEKGQPGAEQEGLLSVKPVMDCKYIWVAEVRIRRNKGVWTGHHVVNILRP